MAETTSTPGAESRERGKGVGEISHSQASSCPADRADRDHAVGGRGQTGRNFILVVQLPSAFVTGRGDDQRLLPKCSSRANERHESVEHPKIATIGLKRDGRGEVHWPVLFLEPLDQAGEIEPERHRHDVRAVFRRPGDGLKRHLRTAASVITKHLANQCLRDASGYADPLAFDLSPEDRACAVRAVAIAITVAAAAEILLIQLDSGEGRMFTVDSGIEYRDDDAVPGMRRSISTDLRESPRRCLVSVLCASLFRQLLRFDENRGHRRGHTDHIRLSCNLVHFGRRESARLDTDFGRGNATRFQAD